MWKQLKTRAVLMFVVFWMVCPADVCAASKDGICFAARMQGEEIITASTAFVYRGEEDKLYALADLSLLGDDEGSGEEYELTTVDGKTCFAEYSGEIKEYSLALLELKEEDYPAAYLGLGSARQNQVVNLVYFDSDAEGYFVSCEVKLTEVEEKEPFSLLQAEFVGENRTGIPTPAALMDDQGKMVGLLTPSKDVIGFESIDFYQEAQQKDAGSDEKEKSPPDNSKKPEESDDKEDGPKEREDPMSRSSSESEGSSGILRFVMLYGVGAVVIVALAGVFFTLKNRKKRRVMDYVSNTQPYREPEASKAFILGVGGEMDGKKFQMEGSEITIGREPFSTVCYPKKTQGVSRKHCALRMQDGRMTLTDRGSSCGTFLEGYGKLSPGQTVDIENGSRFCLGDRKNTFVVYF